MTISGKFVISLDFELLWGVRDHATAETYGENISWSMAGHAWHAEAF